MNQLIELIIFSLLAGSTVFLGFYFSFLFDKIVVNDLIKNKVKVLSIALGLGIMLSAISLVLIPEGIKNLNIFDSTLYFGLGTIFFYLFDKFLEKIDSRFSQLYTMLLDFIPESIALGTMFILNHNIAIVLSILIALQNFPESFNAFYELRNKKISLKVIFSLFITLSFFGLIFSLIGYFFLYKNEILISNIMVFSSAGMLYLIFRDIVPSLRIRSSELTVLFINLGFFIGLLSFKILN